MVQIGVVPAVHAAPVELVQILGVHLGHNGPHVGQGLGAGAVGQGEVPAGPGDVAVHAVAQSGHVVSAQGVGLVAHILGHVIGGDRPALDVVAGGQGVVGLALHGLLDLLPELVGQLGELVLQHGGVHRNAGLGELNFDLTQVSFLLTCLLGVCTSEAARSAWFCCFCLNVSRNFPANEVVFHQTSQMQCEKPSN